MESGLTLVTLAAVIFSSGISFNKLNQVEKKVDKLEKLPERVARLEAKK